MVDSKLFDKNSSLPGKNRMEIMMFTLQDKDQVPDTPRFGINVFDVCELVVAPQLFEESDKRESVTGMANIRGKTVPVIDLNRYFGTSEEQSGNILVVSKANGTTQGFLVHSVHDIEQHHWVEMQAPPELAKKLTDQYSGTALIAIKKLDDGKELLIIDVAQLISEVLGSNHNSIATAEMSNESLVPVSSTRTAMATARATY